MSDKDRFEVMNFLITLGVVAVIGALLVLPMCIPEVQAQGYAGAAYGGSSSAGRSTQTVTGTTGLTITADLVKVTTVGSSYTITLPDATTFPQTRPITIVDTSGTIDTLGPLKIDGNGTQTIDGFLTTSVYDNWWSCNLWSDGSNWYSQGCTTPPLMDLTSLGSSKLWAWYDASNPGGYTLNTGASLFRETVTIVDLSASGLTLNANGASASLPVWTPRLANGRPAFICDNASPIRRIERANVSFTAADLTIFVFAATPAWGANAFYGVTGLGYASGSGIGIALQTSTFKVLSYGNGFTGPGNPHYEAYGPGDALVDSPMVYDKGVIYEFRLGQTGADTSSRTLLDGTAATAEIRSNSTTPATLTNKTLTMCGNGVDVTFQGYIAEMAWLTNSTAAEQALVRKSLMRKYGYVKAP